MRTHLWIAATLLIITVQAAAAQTHQNPGEVFIEQASFNHNEAVVQFTREYSNLAINESGNLTGQDDFDHQANIFQEGSRNLTILSQSGFNNRAILNLIGADNEVSLVQDGGNNTASISLVGSANEVEYLQRGNFNRLDLFQAGSGIRQQFEQIGNNHSLQVYGRGIPMNISQTGNGASAVVETY